MIKEPRYEESWDHLLSVTEIIKSIASPALMNWLRYNTPGKIKAESEKAIDIGKLTHEIIFRIENGEKIEIATKYPQEIKNTVQSYFEWKKENKLEVYKSELKMKSEKLRYKGTLDRLCKSPDGLVLIDWKTGKAIYDDALLQLIAYQKLFEENNGEKISKCIIVRLGKLKPEFEPRQIPAEETEELFHIFNNALAIAYWQKQKEIEYKLKEKEIKNGKNSGKDNG